MTPIEMHILIQDTLDKFRSKLDHEDGLPVDVQRIVDYIHEHLFDEHLSIATLLETLNIRSHNYSSRFRRAMYQCGQPSLTIRAYIEHHRIQAAILLLNHEHISVSQTAFSIGYSHYETFHRAFKRCMGYSPAQHNGRKHQEIVSCNDAATQV
jgi:AraC-like DNA-binding protein